MATAPPPPHYSTTSAAAADISNHGAGAAGSGADRPTVDERRRYEPRGRQEEFIVPLLREAILAALAESRPGRSTSGAGQSASALDVGCGGQPFRGAIEERGFSYVSMDVQAQEGITLDHACAVDGELPVALRARGPFELILCTEVLEHVADWDAAFANLAELLATGGRLIVTCPHVYPLHEEPYDFWRPTLHALRRFADRHGLVVVEERKLGDAWDVLGTVIAAATPDPTGTGPLAWLGATIARKTRKVAFWVVKSGLLRKMSRPRSKLYLSNFVVLTKAEAGVGTQMGSIGKGASA